MADTEMLDPTDRTLLDHAADRLLATKRGIGMIPPFYAETGSNKGDENWPLWIVRNKSCNSLGVFMPRDVAELLADAMNRRSAADVAAERGADSSGLGGAA